MRTTIEIPDKQHRELVAIAQKRGLKGFSQVVQEAVAAYIADLASDEVEMLLSLESSIDDSEANEMQRRIDRVP